MRDIQPLIEYIQQNRSAGILDEAIRNSLLQDGTWSEEEVASALSYNPQEQADEVTPVDNKPDFKKIAMYGLAALLLVFGVLYASYFSQQKLETKKVFDSASNGVNTEEITQTSPYSIARTQDAPYLCKYNVVSFFEEKDYFEARILGDDFYSEQVPSPLDLERQEKYGMEAETPTRFAKKDGWAYLWLESQDGGFKFNYDEVKSFIKKQDPTFSYFREPGLLVEPSPDDVCERTDVADISVPNFQFTDITGQITSGAIPLEPREQLSFGNTIYGYQFVIPEGWYVSDSNSNGQDVFLINDPNSSSDNGALGSNKIAISITNFEDSYFNNVSEVDTEEKVVKKATFNGMPGIVRIENNEQKATVVAFKFEFGAEKALSNGVDAGKLANGVVVTLAGDVQEELLVNLASSFVSTEERRKEVLIQRSIYDVALGDQMNDMEVTSIKIYPSEYLDGTQDFIVEFSGEVVVTGRLFGPVMGCDVGLQLDDPSAELLPELKEYNDLGSLCFENDQDVTNEVGIERIRNKEIVTIVIDNFKLDYNHKGGGPNATFVSVSR